MRQVPSGETVHPHPDSSRLDAATRYLARGWQPVPVPRDQKGAAFKRWPDFRVTHATLDEHFAGPGNISILTGEPSGWLIDVDLDCNEAVELADEYLPHTGAVTGREGRPRSHRWYIAPDLPTKQFRDPVTNEMIVEMRSTGGQSMVGPSTHPDGGRYDVLSAVPTTVAGHILRDSIDRLHRAVCELRGHRIPERRAPQRTPITEPMNCNDEVRLRRAAAYLDAMPAAIAGQGGHSHTYSAATAMVHGFGLTEQQAMSLLLDRFNPRCEPPWSEHQMLHKVTDAATKPHEKPREWLLQDRSDHPVAATTPRPSPPPKKAEDLLTADRLHVPGFIGQVMDHCLETAPYPNPVLAFGGALALQAFLAGRVVRDPGDVRPNIYIVTLAPSGAGKDWPRKLNARILHGAGLIDCLGDQLGSGEGIQDALLRTPSMLVQTDEFDSLLQAIGRSRDARYESIMATLLSAYSSANSVVPIRKLAKQDVSRSIDQPNLVLYGSAIPQHFFAALSDRMLTNGLLGRSIVLEASRRGRGRRAGRLDPPETVLATARWWAKQAVHSGEAIAPRIVPLTPQAESLADHHRQHHEDQYDRAIHDGNAAAATVWARVAEHTSKLALLYAVSEDHEMPAIDVDAVEWANGIVLHLTRRMLVAFELHTSSSPFDAAATKCLRHIIEAPGQQIDRSLLLRKTRFEKSHLDQIIETLKERGDIVEETRNTGGRSATVYRYVGNEAEGSAKERGLG